MFPPKAAFLAPVTGGASLPPAPGGPTSIPMPPPGPPGAEPQSAPPLPDIAAPAPLGPVPGGASNPAWPDTASGLAATGNAGAQLNWPERTLTAPSLRAKRAGVSVGAGVTRGSSPSATGNSALTSAPNRAGTALTATANAARGNLCAPALGHREEHVIGALPAGQAVATGDGSMDRDGDGMLYSLALPLERGRGRAQQYGCSPYSRRSPT